MPSMSNLVTLSLGGNKIGDAGAEKIAAVMPSTPSLVELDFPIRSPKLRNTETNFYLIFIVPSLTTLKTKHC